MKLEPIAKPIRIRIKLGDSEHSSLDSLKSNFSIKELFPLFKDGRLERWLMQIGEVQLAHRVEDFQKQCGEGEIKDYIQFLSLFFDEVADSLSKYKNNGEWSLNDFLSTASLDSIKIIYANTKGLKTKEADKEKIDWAEYFGRILSKENVFSIFEDPQLHSVYDDDEWGIELSELVKTDEDYKSIFTYLEMYSRNNQHLEGCKDIIYRFYSESAEKGYRWESVFKDDLSIEYLSNIYQNVCFQILGIDWGTLFAECVKDWEKDHEKIEKIIEGNPHDKISFYNRCSEKGFEEAKMKTYLTAPLPGTITSIKVKEGDAVKAGQTVIVMAAMRMDNNITAECDGTVKAILVQQGAQVQSGDALIEIG